MAFASIAPSTFDFTGTYEIRQGADWIVVVTIRDANGVPLDLSEYNATAPVADFIDGNGSTSGVCQPDISWVGGGTGGEIQFWFKNADSTAATVLSGSYQLEITYDTAPPTLKNRILAGTWSMSRETTT